MPPLSSALALVARNATTNSSLTSSASDPHDNALQVVCAWPVSGQYGPGSRVLYYVLVAACVFAGKHPWLRNACLAGALLFPAVAALHGIVLAALHVNGAVDMDVYGAFQLCSIGILAGPVTVRRSLTYFADPARNIIFWWSGLILAGLLSLAVEFYRSTSSDCTQGGPGINVHNFPYNITCGLQCSVDSGPTSLIRGGSGNNINVVPAPDRLSFNTAMLLAAACCIPAILMLILMWINILEIDWRRRFRRFRFGEEDQNVAIEGTNGATPAMMKMVQNNLIKFHVALEVILFGAGVFAILVIGERNFFSPQVWYQTEPIGNVGQWAPIVGTGLAVFGSIYLVMKGVDLTASRKKTASPISSVDPDVSLHSHPGEDQAQQSRDTGRIRGSIPTTSRPDVTNTPATRDVAMRPQVAKALDSVFNYFVTAAQDRFDDSEFTRGDATNYPVVPGEEQRNRTLPQTIHYYNQSIAPSRQRSRAPSVRSRTSSPERVTSHETRSSLGRLHTRGTLEVPSSPVDHGDHRLPQNDLPDSITPVLTVPEGESSPAIMVSSHEHAGW